MSGRDALITALLMLAGLAITVGLLYDDARPIALLVGFSLAAFLLLAWTAPLSPPGKLRLALFAVGLVVFVLSFLAFEGRRALQLVGGCMMLAAPVLAVLRRPR
jgi:hypothetical protein